MREILLSEGYFPDEMFDFMIKEELAHRYGWLPSQVDKENLADLELLLAISQVKDELNPHRNIKM